MWVLSPGLLEICRAGTTLQARVKVGCFFLSLIFHIVYRTILKCAPCLQNLSSLSSHFCGKEAEHHNIMQTVFVVFLVSFACFVQAATIATAAVEVCLGYL